MKALLIDGAAKTVVEIDVKDKSDLGLHIGFDSLIDDALSSDESIYFDEDCFIRGSQGRFQLDNLAPIAGKGVVIGLSGDVLKDTALSEELLAGRLKFL